MKKSKTTVRICLLLLLLLFAIGGIGFFIYVFDYYHAKPIAIELMVADNNITNEGKYTILSPESGTGTGIIFYPGAKVEHTAYLPLLEKLRQKGFTCVLVEMPFRLAVFQSNAANKVFEKLPEIKTWFIAGHSLGGAMASKYAASHPDKVSGVILLGAYIYGDLSTAQALTIYGSEDQVLDREKITYKENVVVLEGGNHAQFGCYGLQDGDGSAQIDTDKQQELTVDAIVKFIDNYGLHGV